MNITSLEPEYLQFIKKKNKYGTPIMMARPGQTILEQNLEGYYHKQSMFQAFCVPCGCPCPCNMICWTVLLPAALYSCITKMIGSKEKASVTAEYIRRVRCVLFPTMIVELSKDGNGTVNERKVVNFLDHDTLSQDIVDNIDDANNDGINGCIQNSMVPEISAVNVYGNRTREVFLGGDRNNPRNFKNVKVPEMQIMIPMNEAQAFSKELQQVFRNIKSGDFERSLDYVESQQPEK